MEEKKFCKFCGEQIEKSSMVCPKCGRQLELIKDETINNSIQESPTAQFQEPDKPKFYTQEWFMWAMLIIFAPIGILLMFKFNKRLTMKVKIILAAIFGVLFLLFTFIPSDTETNDNPQENTNSNEEIDNNTNIKTTYSFDEIFEFDDLEITIGSGYTFVKVDNQYSEYYQKDIVKLPITVKNTKDETHSLNMFYYTIFGSTGTETDNTWVYFDDSVESSGELRSGSSYTKYLYFLYDGNGTYAIEFDDIWDQKTVEIEINK